MRLPDVFYDLCYSYGEDYRTVVAEAERYALMSIEAKHPDGMRPIHPGEVMFEEIIKELDLVPYDVAAQISVDYGWFMRFLSCQENITPEIAEKFANMRDPGLRAPSSQSWLDMQKRYDDKIRAQKVVAGNEE